MFLTKIEFVVRRMFKSDHMTAVIGSANIILYNIIPNKLFFCYKQHNMMLSSAEDHFNKTILPIKL